MKALTASAIAFALVASVEVSAQTISEKNVFNTGSNEATVTMSNEYSDSTFPHEDAVDLTSSQAFFGDYERGGTDPTSDTQLMTISNFSAPAGIGSLVFYDPNQYEPGRVATQVTVYYSLSDTTSQNPTNFVALNGGNPFTLALNSNGHYTTASSGTYFDELTDLGIPSGAQSILLDFGPDHYAYPQSNGSDYYVGVGFQEIQAFAPVPEPSTWALMGGGILGLCLLRRLRVA
jgi:hypothetical protein